MSARLALKSAGLIKGVWKMHHRRMQRDATYARTVQEAALNSLWQSTPARALGVVLRAIVDILRGTRN